jgi:hypothetical protein
MLILYIDEGIPKHALSHLRLYIDSSWRLEKGGAVVVGYADSELEVLEALKGLWGKTILRVAVLNKNFDLKIDFEGGIALKVFTNARGCEQWELRRSDGFRLSIRDGLRIVTAHENPDPERPSE